MDAWTENCTSPHGFDDKETIFSTANHDYTIRSTIIDMGGDRSRAKTGRLSQFVGLNCRDEADRRSFAERFQDFGSSTTFHGIGQVTNNKHNGFRRLIWLAIVLGMSAWLITNITLVIVQYFQYPTTSSISINYVDNMTFPAVTLCNFNQFRSSLFTPEELGFITHLYSDNPPASIDIDDTLILGSPENLDELFAYFSHQLEAMLEECTWRSVERCTAQNFTRRFTDHGVCFTFNDPDDESERLQVRSAGSKDGLYLRLYAETDEYIFGENTAAGFRILLHPQGVMPLVKELGFSVSPGFESSIAVRQTLVKSLPAPFKSNCTTSTLNYSRTYSVPSCRFECKIEYIVEKCGCRDYRWPGSAPVCSPRQQFHCIYPQEAEFQKKEIECSCPISCETTTYESRVSMGYWPAGHITDFLEAHTNFTEEFLRKNYLDVYIFFEELMYLEIEQKGTHTMTSVQSDIGGYMGLLCGMSLITLMEWADFLLVSLFRKCRAR